MVLEDTVMAGVGATLPPAPVRIGLVEDHEALVHGIRVILSATEDLRLVADAATVPELLGRRVELDVAVLDLRLSDDSNPAANVAALRAAGVAVLAYTSGDDPRLVRMAARAGVGGMVRKSEPCDALVAAIRTIAAGGVVASADWAAAIDGDPDHVPTLTAREAEVLALYATGEKADRVARLLGISRETVLDHIRRIRVKYAAQDRAAHTKVDLYRRAVEDGMLPEP